MSKIDYTSESFHTPYSRVQELPMAISKYLNKHTDRLRLLDIGCSNGAVALALANIFPDADITGVDISPKNIINSKELAKESLHSDRLRFIECDYHDFHDPYWDGIISDTTLHLIPNTNELFKKIAKELSPEGILAITAPYKCPYNTAIIVTRAIYKRLNCRFVRNFIKWFSKLIYPNASDQFMNERLQYMSVLPIFQFDDAFLQHVDSLGLKCIQYTPLERIFGKLDHALVVFKKYK